MSNPSTRLAPHTGEVCTWCGRLVEADSVYALTCKRCAAAIEEGEFEEYRRRFMEKSDKSASRDENEAPAEYQDRLTQARRAALWRQIEERKRDLQEAEAELAAQERRRLINETPVTVPRPVLGVGWIVRCLQHWVH